MIILLDTNVALDYLLKREGYKEAKDILELAATNQDIDCVTTTTITDMHYISSNFREEKGQPRKYNSFQVQEMLSDFLDTVVILPVTEDNIKEALMLRWEDLEDAIQYSAALKGEVDCILTNNISDFSKSQIPCFTPKDFLDNREQIINTLPSHTQKHNILKELIDKFFHRTCNDSK